MSKAKKILTLLSKGKTIKEVAKVTKSSEAYVYYVRWNDAKQNKQAPKKAKKKAVYKSERSKLVKAVFDTVKDINAVKDGPKIHKSLDGKVAWVEIPDLVNNPPHYTDGGVDTLKFIEVKDLNYRLGNVVKYVSRAGKKVDSDPVQDLEKARFYLEREILARRSA